MTITNTQRTPTADTLQSAVPSPTAVTSTIHQQIQTAESAPAVWTAVDQWRRIEVLQEGRTVGEQDALEAIRRVNHLLWMAMEEAETEGVSYGQRVLMAAVRAMVDAYREE
jgi:hypothetical protein